MLIISNDCVGGYHYQANEHIYNNPFIWSVIGPNSMKYLLTHWNQIDFNNIKLDNSPFEPNTFMIVIDKAVYVHYPHNIKDNNHPVLVSKFGNNYYSKADELTYTNYTKRLARMQYIKDTPQFIITENPLPRFHYSLSKIERILSNIDLSFNTVVAIHARSNIIPPNVTQLLVPSSLIIDPSHGRTNRLYAYIKPSLSTCIQCSQ